jgi:hypothetical protein
MTEGNDMTQARQRDVPSGEVKERSLGTLLASDANQLVTTLATMGVAYTAKKIADRNRKPPDPPPPPSSDSNSEA